MIDTMSGPLFETIYVSASVKGLPDEELQRLLKQSRTNNVRDGITGMLLYSDGSFLQILEGPKTAVTQTVSRILQDDRHHLMIVMTEGPIEERTFSEWSMGFARASQTDLLAMEGSNDFFAEGETLKTMPPGRAKRLLEHFLRTNH
ncbi:BLUF domain-containing protein [bacterium]|nr:MAG: BLUF domain-containing protein [bacterium]